jgi:hypothetical protein
MATIAVPKPVVMEFALDTEKIFKEVRHFNLINGPEVFSSKLNIGVNRGFSNSKHDYSLKIRLGNKWSGQITGLYSTYDPDIYYGDTKGKKNLVIVRFMHNSEKLRLYFFQNFYTRQLTDFLKRFKESY